MEFEVMFSFLNLIILSFDSPVKCVGQHRGEPGVRGVAAPAVDPVDQLVGRARVPRAPRAPRAARQHVHAGRVRAYVCKKH